jgi:thiamine-phosphate pyrophosphorylase
VELLISGGACWIQIREKQLPDEELIVQVEDAIQVAKPAGVKILINDRVGVALKTKADGIHLGQEDFPVEEARALLPHAIIGFSTHNLTQASSANSLAADYISIGPIFPTRTKTENPSVGIDVLRRVRREVSKPLVAVGGITLENVLQVWDAGADSVAVVSDIMKYRGHIGSRTAGYLKLWNKFHA